MRFDESRMREQAFEGAEDGIETLDVTDLQNEMILRRERRQLLSVRNVLRNRLLDQQMFASLKQPSRHFVMRIGWCGHGGRVNHPGKFIERPGRHRTKLFCN